MHLHPGSVCTLWHRSYLYSKILRDKTIIAKNLSFESQCFAETSAWVALRTGGAAVGDYLYQSDNLRVRAHIRKYYPFHEGQMVCLRPDEEWFVLRSPQGFHLICDVKFQLDLE